MKVRHSLRTLDLKDLTLIGSPRQDPRVFADLVSYIKAGETPPLVVEPDPLRDLRGALEAVLETSNMGGIGIVIAGWLRSDLSVDARDQKPGI